MADFRPTPDSRDALAVSAPARRAGAFSLVELVAVMVLVGILAAVAAPSFGGLGRTRELGVARGIAKDLTFARQRAVATGTTTWITFSPPDSWSVLAEDPASPGLAGAQPLGEHGTGRPMTRTIGRGAGQGVWIAEADFDGTASVGFDWLGRPFDGDETELGTAGVVRVSGGHEVRVERGTGHAWLEAGP